MKHKSGYRLINLIAVVSIMFLSSCTNSHNWPQFRGTESNMLPAGKSLPEGPQPGQGPQPGGPGPEDNDTSFKADIYRWEVTCIDLNTGKELWKQVAFKGNPRVGKQPMNSYASETPVTDGKRIYVYFGMTGLYCYDMNGKPLWQKDLGAFKTQGGWGTGSSPVIHQGILYIKVDNEVNSFIVAIDGATGGKRKYVCNQGRS
ncbi:MAG: PQQ-like beta-propeller repeat protein [Bacteroidales bacterium]|nr:PQQ-like beta-propeller repeat protein [Bacteroidales bacterium]